jgi:hypothetical protein
MKNVTTKNQKTREGKNIIVWVESGHYKNQIYKIKNYKSIVYNIYYYFTIYIYYIRIKRNR